MEKLKLPETLSEVGHIALDGLKFVIERLQGGGWDNLPR
jgi:hypothetical protein